MRFAAVFPYGRCEGSLWLAPSPPLFGKFQHGAFVSKLRAKRKGLHCRLGQYLLTLDLDFLVDLPASDSWTLPFETNHFLPDNTVYDTESGSYLDSYSSFKQTRAPVVLMYWKKYIYIIKLHVVLASYNCRHGRLTTKTFALDPGNLEELCVPSAILW